VETSESQVVLLSIKSARTVLSDKAGELVKVALYTCLKGWVATLLR
jgi:hypothetical protein